MAGAAIKIDLDKIEHNSRAVVKLCRQHFVEVAGVTNGTFGDPEIARAMTRGGIRQIADSRISNIQGMRGAGVEAEFILLTSPSESSVKDVVRWADTSLACELEVLKELGSEGVRKGKEHGVILEVALDDTQNGVHFRKLGTLAEEAMSIPGIKVEGVGSHMPSEGELSSMRAKMKHLAYVASAVQRALGLRFRWISSSNRANLPLLIQGTHPGGVNHLRIGRAILFGMEQQALTAIPTMYQDALRISGELVNVQEAVSREVVKTVPGPPGTGMEPLDFDRLARGVLSIDRSDVSPEGLRPCDPSVAVVDGDMDRVAVIFPRGSREEGDVLDFVPTNGSLIKAMSSSRVKKIYVGA